MDLVRKITEEAFDQDWKDLSPREKDIAKRAVRWCIAHQSQLPVRRSKAVPESVMLSILDECVQEEFSRSLAELQRRDRRRIVVDARNMAMLIYINRMRTTLKATGALFNLTHASVIHGLNSAKFLIDFDTKYYDKFYSLKSKIDLKCENYLTSHGESGSSPGLF